MLSTPWIALLFSLAATGQAPADTGVARVVGPGVYAVAQVRLVGDDLAPSVRRMLGEVAGEADVAAFLQALDARASALKRAGASEFDLLFDMSGRPNRPVVVVPLADGAKADEIARLLGDRTIPSLWRQSVETIRGNVVAGSPDDLARIGAETAVEPTRVADALGAGGDAPIRLAIIPGRAILRALEESMPRLPDSVGGGPIEVVTRGVKWATATIRFAPRPTARLVVQASDEPAAKALGDLLRKSFVILGGGLRKAPTTAPMAPVVLGLTPEIEGDRVAVAADLGPAAALVSVPVLQLRESSRRVTCTNNLKQIGLGMHNYLSTNDTFPPAFRADRAGKPLLSWRVLILPFVEQMDLFNEFHLDEPWDSPHNKALIPRMPKVYACPDQKPSLTAAGMTTYLAPRGPSTMFPGGTGVKIKDVTDGTSTTILVVDAPDSAAVPWTSPADWEVGAGATIQSLVGHHTGGVNVVIADGLARFFRDSIEATLWQALLSRNGGEVVNYNDL